MDNETITNQIDLLLSRNTDIINQIKVISGEVEEEVNSNVNIESFRETILNEKIYTAGVLSKKLKDNNATINDLTRLLEYDDSYFEESIDNFKKRASWSEDNLATNMTVATIETAEVKFINTGFFYAWDATKNIQLGFKVIDIDNNEYVNLLFPLDPTGDNLPGDEITNEDQGKVKTFDISFTVPSVAPGMYYAYFQITNGVYNFRNHYQRSIYIT